VKKIIFVYIVIVQIGILFSQDSPLNQYSQTTYPSLISWIEDDLSGVTINHDNGHLYLIEDDNGIIWETDQDLTLIRTIYGGDFGDTEDIVYLGNHEYAIVIESGDLFIGIIPTGDSDINIDPEDFQKVTFDIHDENSGPEGIAFDTLSQTFFVVKEKDPMVFYQFQRPSGTSDTTIIPNIPFDAENEFEGIMEDLSSIVFDYRTGRVLILSDQTKRLIDVDQNSGDIIGAMSIYNMEQPEGVSFNNGYDILVVGEPNYYTQYTYELGLEQESQINNFIIEENYPNPFNSNTKINFNIPVNNFTRISVFDLNGKESRILINKYLEKGQRSISWDGRDNNGKKVSSGMYIYMIETGGLRQTHTMTLIQ
jgi:uncharacterized protein YjiK|tara:strand:- start:13816 stop:14916 length:1101 start_codon:yes stop_codon:yes gene_type:complete